MLVNVGAIPILIDLLKENNFAINLVARNALGIISTHVDYLRPLAQVGSIPPLRGISLRNQSPGERNY